MRLKAIIAALSAAALLSLAVRADPASLGAAVSPAVQALEAAVAAGDRQAVQNFWKNLERTGTPILESAPGEPGKTLVTFVSRSAAQSSAFVQVPMEDGILPLARVPGTDVWSRTFLLSAAARGPYALAWPEGRTSDPRAIDTYARSGPLVFETFLDPLAARTSPWVADVVRPPVTIAWFEGPAASKQPYLGERTGIAKGRLETRHVASRILGNERLVSVYVPAGYPVVRRQRYDLAVLFDREDFLFTMGAQTLLDNLIADRAIPPCVVVLVSPIDNDTRSRELPGNLPFQDFILDELMPEIRREYAVTQDPRRIAIGGASYGGLSATLIAVRSPQTFGNVISLSGAFWWGPDLIERSDGEWDPQISTELPARIASTPKRALRFYMSVGRWEGQIMLGPNRHLRDVLAAKGYPLSYAELEGGHDWISWRAVLPDALITALGRDAVVTP